MRILGISGLEQFVPFKKTHWPIETLLGTGIDFLFLESVLVRRRA